MSWTEPTPIRTNEHGDEEHESFGTVRLSRLSSTGTRLFDSSITHHDFVRMAITPATRKRELHKDWIHASRTPIIEVDLSLAQWAAMMSSFGQGEGTPVTITARDGRQVPRAADDESRLAVTSREVASAASAATEKIATATAAVAAAFERKAGRREMSEVINTLGHVVGNAPSNMRFVADSLTRHAEDVVTKAKADIEATALRVSGSQLTGEVVHVPELES